MMNYTPSRRDWTEDFEHENGQYLCNCKKCGETFMGHKRRPLCKSCDKPRWIAHVTNCMPARLKPDTLVNVAFKSDVFDTCPMTAEWWEASWCISDPASRIIAYQILEETK